MGVIIRQSLKGTFVNYVGVLLGIFVQFYIVAKYLDPEVIGLSKVVYEVAFLLSTLALMGSGSIICMASYCTSCRSGCPSGFRSSRNISFGVAMVIPSFVSSFRAFSTGILCFLNYE